MATMAICGAPYHVGDPILVNGFEAEVVHIERNGPAPFGLVWRMDVRVEEHPHTTIVVRADDDGYNHTVGQRVGPSERIF
jgi:hypothetical protein